MFRAVEIRVLERYRLWLRYDDGTEGEGGLSDLAGRGVLSAWLDPTVFKSVRIDESGALAWPGEIDLFPDALYLRLTGKAPGEIFPKLRTPPLGA